MNFSLCRHKMTECKSASVNLLDCQLDKLKSATKKFYQGNYKIMTTDMIGMDKINFYKIYD